jgi:hypothetical protein
MYTEQQLQHIVQNVAELQHKFSADIKKSRLFTNLAIGCFVSLFIFAYLIVIPVLIPILLVLMVIFALIGDFYGKKYAENYKSKVVTQTLKHVIPNVEFCPKQGFESFILFNREHTFPNILELLSKNKKPRLKGSGIFDFSPHEYKSEDYIKFDFENWLFEAAEIKTIFKNGKHSETVFEGIAIKLTLPVFFSYDLVIQSKNLTQKAIYKNEIRLESTEWENTFWTYCEDDVFVRYILNPAVMVRILDLNKRYPGLGISFMQNNIYIFWDNRVNMFEPVIKIQDTNEMSQNIRKNLADWESIFDLVKELQLGREIWTQKQFLSYVVE